MIESEFGDALWLCAYLQGLLLFPPSPRTSAGLPSSVLRKPRCCESLCDAKDISTTPYLLRSSSLLEGAVYIFGMGHEGTRAVFVLLF